MSNRPKAYLALLGNAAIWGVALPLAKKGFTETGPNVFLFYRYLFAVISGLPFVVFLWPKIKCSLKELPALAGISFLATILGHWLLYAGLDRTSALESSLITILIPIAVSVGAALFLKETITGQEKIGTAIAFLGSLVIVLEPLFLNNRTVSFTHTLGNIMVFAYVFTWSLAVLWMKKIAKKVHPLTLSYMLFVFGLIGYMPLALWENPQFFQTNYFSLPYALTAAAYMGILGSTVAFFLLQYGQKLIEASEASLFSYLTVLFSLPLAVFWLKEPLTLPFIIGGVIVTAGIVLAESRRQPRLARK